MLWTSAVQQLSNEPVETAQQGQAVIAAALQSINSFDEQQRLAFDDLASKDDALSVAEARSGELMHCLLQLCHLHDVAALSSSLALMVL